MLSQLNPVLPIDPYLPKVHLQISCPFSIPLGRAKESVQVRGALKHFVTINKFTVRGCSPTPNPQAGGPLLVGCPRLLIKYRSYLPHPEDFPPSTTWGRAMLWWQGTHLTWQWTSSRTQKGCLYADWRSSRRWRFKSSSSGLWCCI
jgi:hypothetical protein